MFKIRDVKTINSGSRMCVEIFFRFLYIFHTPGVNVSWEVCLQSRVKESLKNTFFYHRIKYLVLHRNNKKFMSKYRKSVFCFYIYFAMGILELSEKLRILENVRWRNKFDRVFWKEFKKLKFYIVFTHFLDLRYISILLYYVKVHHISSL